MFLRFGLNLMDSTKRINSWPIRKILQIKGPKRKSWDFVRTSTLPFHFETFERSTYHRELWQHGTGLYGSCPMKQEFLLLQGMPSNGNYVPRPDSFTCYVTRATWEKSFIHPLLQHRTTGNWTTKLTALCNALLGGENLDSFLTYDNPCDLWRK